MVYWLFGAAVIGYIVGIVAVMWWVKKAIGYFPMNINKDKGKE